MSSTHKRSPYPWIATGCIGSALVLTALFGAGATIAALVLFLWFGSPGLALSMSRRVPLSVDAIVIGISAGCAASLVCIALVGLVTGRFEPAWALVAPLPLVVAVRAAGRRRDELPPASVAAMAGSPWLAAAMLAGIVLAVPALAGLGAQTEAGVSFRPFFNADFFKHLGIAQGFAIGELPPRDLFGQGGHVQYYWLQHLIPGILLGLESSGLAPVAVLGAVGGWQTVLLGIALFSWARRYTDHDPVAFAAVLLATASLSLDGLATWMQTGTWLESARTINMEALDLTTAMFLTGDQIAASTLYRLNLYIPQHQLCAILFVAWCLAGADDRHPDSASGAARLALLAAMPATSLLLGVPAVGVACLVAGCRSLQWRRVPWWDLSGAAIALMLPLAASMISLDSSAARFATNSSVFPEAGLWSRLAWLPLQLLTSMGVMLPLAIIGIIVSVKSGGGRNALVQPPTVALLAMVAGYGVAEAVLPANQMRIDAELKLSFLLGLSLVPLAACAMSTGLRNVGPAMRVGLAVLFVAGLASPVYDTLWHSCTPGNCRQGPWQATAIPLSDWEALGWIRTNTPRDAMFQQSPQADYFAGGPDVWIPAFAGRPLYASRRGSRSDSRTLAQAARLFELDGGVAVSQQARELKIQFLYLSRRLEGKSFSGLVQAYTADPGLSLVFSNGDASIWRVEVDHR